MRSLSIGEGSSYSLVAPALLAVDDDGVRLAELGAGALGGGVVRGLELLVVRRHRGVGDAELLGHAGTPPSHDGTWTQAGHASRCAREPRPWPSVDPASAGRTDLRLRDSWVGRAYASAPFHMRLVTYDRGGQRRLGAILEGEVVDLPDAVGHPAFPTTLEGLVSSSRGTVMDAARTALARDDVIGLARPAAADPDPLVPRVAAVARRRSTWNGGWSAPSRTVPWPDGAAWLEYEPKVAAVLGLETSTMTRSTRCAAPLRLHARERLAGARRERRAGRARRRRARSRSARAWSPPTRSTRR